MAIDHGSEGKNNSRWVGFEPVFALLQCVSALAQQARLLRVGLLKVVQPPCAPACILTMELRLLLGVFHSLLEGALLQLIGRNFSLCVSVWADACICHDSGRHLPL